MCFNTFFYFVFFLSFLSFFFHRRILLCNKKNILQNISNNRTPSSTYIQTWRFDEWFVIHHRNPFHISSTKASLFRLKCQEIKILTYGNRIHCRRNVVQQDQFNLMSHLRLLREHICKVGLRDVRFLRVIRAHSDKFLFCFHSMCQQWINILHADNIKLNQCI